MLFVVMKNVESKIWSILISFQFIAVRAFEERRLARRRFRRGRIGVGLRSIGLRWRFVDSRIAFIRRWRFGIDVFFSRFFVGRFCFRFVSGWWFVWFLWLVEPGTKLKLYRVVLLTGLEMEHFLLLYVLPPEHGFFTWNELLGIYLGCFGAFLPSLFELFVIVNQNFDVLKQRVKLSSHALYCTIFTSEIRKSASGFLHFQGA